MGFEIKSWLLAHCGSAAAAGGAFWALSTCRHDLSVLRPPNIIIMLQSSYWSSWEMPAYLMKKKSSYSSSYSPSYFVGIGDMFANLFGYYPDKYSAYQMKKSVLERLLRDPTVCTAFYKADAITYWVVYCYRVRARARFKWLYGRYPATLYIPILLVYF